MNTPLLSTTSNGHAAGAGQAPTPACDVAPASSDTVPAIVESAAPSTAALQRREVSLVPRRRDKDGNRLPWFFAYHTPTVGGRPSAETAMSCVFQAVRDGDPAAFAAGRLEHQYDDVLQEAGRRLAAFVQTCEARVGGELARARANNAEIDRLQDEAGEAGAKDAAAFDAPLAAAHDDAARKVSAVGCAYAPEAPDAACVLGRVTREDPLAVAGDIRVPFHAVQDAGRKFSVGTALSWLSVGVGALVGVSFLLAIHVIGIGDLKSPARLPEEWPLLAGGVLVGIAIAVGAKLAVHRAAKETGKQFWLGNSPGMWGPRLALTGAQVVGFSLLDAVMEREGLMSGVRVADALTGRAGGDTSKDLFYLMLGLIVVVGYLVACAWDGYVHGQREGCLARIAREVDTRFAAADAAWRSREDVRAALGAIAQVQTLRSQRGRAETRTAKRLADLEAKRLPEITDLAPEEKRIAQELHDQFVAAQDQYDRMLDGAERDIRGVRGSWWTRFWRRVTRGRFAARQRTRESKRCR